MKLCERLRELRSERDLRLKDVAARSGLSVPYLSDLERGRTNPSLDTLRVLSAASVADNLGERLFQSQNLSQPAQ